MRLASETRLIRLNAVPLTGFMWNLGGLLNLSWASNHLSVKGRKRGLISLEFLRGLDELIFVKLFVERAPGIKGPYKYFKNNKILMVIKQLCLVGDERSMNIYEISASLHKEAGEILQGHNELAKQQQTPIAKEMEAANKTMPAWLGTGWAKVSDSNGCKQPTGNIAMTLKDGPASQTEEDSYIYSERRGFSVTLRWLSAIWAKCQKEYYIFSPNSELKILTCKSGFADQKMKGSET